MIVVKFRGGPADGYQFNVADDEYRPGQVIEINRDKHLYATAIPLDPPLPQEIILFDVGPAKKRAYREK